MRLRYRHFRTRQQYEVIGLGLDTASEQEVVIYRPLYACEYQFFTRPAEEFYGTVQVMGQAGLVEVRRFSLVVERSPIARRIGAPFTWLRRQVMHWLGESRRGDRRSGGVSS